MSSQDTNSGSQTTDTDASASASPPMAMPQRPAQDPSLRGVVGLQNMGNTCYANATIQLIRCAPEISALIVDESLSSQVRDPSCGQGKVILAYQDLIRTMWMAYRPSYVRPMGFLTEIAHCVRDTVYSNFGMRMQNDSHEYLVYLLDNFHEALNKNKGVTVPETTTVRAPGDTPMTELAENGWNEFAVRNKSPIIDLCFGMIRQTTECQNCRKKSHQWQTFNVFKIPCEGATFADWIAAEFNPEEIEGYDCTACRPTRQRATLSRHIWQMPAVLFASLRRFTPDMRKIMTPCPYDGSAMNFDAYFAPESNHPSRAWKYDLRGIVDHHGSHMGGHYSAQISHPSTHDWWMIDDEMSMRLEGPRLRHPSNYMYLFRKQA
jgi:ubiquitin C-terminal hydrolase